MKCSIERSTGLLMLNSVKVNPKINNRGLSYKVITLGGQSCISIVQGAKCNILGCCLVFFYEIVLNTSCVFASPYCFVLGKKEMD